MQRIQHSALVGLVMASLAGGAQATDGLTATEVKIGMVNVQTGPASGLGKGMRYGAEAVVVGEVRSAPAGRVLLKTAIGSHRVVDVLSGEMLPRIC